MPIRARRTAREWALKTLYQIEVGKDKPAEALQLLAQEQELDPEAFDFIENLVEGVSARKRELDDRIGALSHEWALDRQPTIDRNILRLAAYEILYLGSIPAAASINEAVELAKKYSTAESGRFVNGVLGALLETLPKKSRPHNIKEAS